VLSEAQVAVLQEEMARVIEDRDRGDITQPVLCHNLTGNPEQPVWQVVNIWEASDPYRALIANPTVVEEMGQLTGASALRIAGGTFTKIADIDSDLMKLVSKTKEDAAPNPGITAACTGATARVSYGPSATGF